MKDSISSPRAKTARKGVYSAAGQLRAALFLLAGIAFFLTAWKLLSLRLNTDIILPPPETVLSRLLQITRTKGFWQALGATTLRTLKGFALSFILGAATAIPAGLSPSFRSFIKPLLSILRSVPVMSFILLAMLWFVTDTVPIFVCFLMVYPLVFANVLEGLGRVDKGLLEMGKIYNLSLAKRICHIILPSLTPFLIAAANAGLGMAWKVTIAAEVLCQPRLAIGTRMQYAQINLETAQVLAWTAAAILLSALCEKVIGGLARRLAPEKRL